MAKGCDGLYLQISTIKVGSRKEELFWPSRPSPCYNIVDGLANVALSKDWSEEKGTSRTKQQGKMNGEMLMALSVEGSL